MSDSRREQTSLLTEKNGISITPAGRRGKMLFIIFVIRLLQL